MVKNNSNKFIYKDITSETLNNKHIESSVIIDKFFVDKNGIKHPIMNQEKISIVDKDSQEYKMAYILVKEFGGKVHIVPRIETEKGYKGLVKVKTPDYIWNNCKWDLKTPTQKGKFENTLERFLKKKFVKQQAKKYIIDYIFFPNKTNKEIIDVIKFTLANRNWVEDLIVMRGKEVICVFSQDKKNYPSSTMPSG